MSENFAQIHVNRKVHCNLSNQYHITIIYIYIIYIFMSLLSWGTKGGTDSNCLLRKVWRFSTAKACGWSERCLGRRRLGGFHIELAQEIIKSHADWNGSSSDSDLWDKITRAPLARREIAESADTFRGRMSWNGLGLDHLDLWSMWDFVGRSQGSRLSKVTNDLLGWHHIN